MLLLLLPSACCSNSRLSPALMLPTTTSGLWPALHATCTVFAEGVASSGTAWAGGGTLYGHDTSSNLWGMEQSCGQHRAATCLADAQTNNPLCAAGSPLLLIAVHHTHCRPQPFTLALLFPMHCRPADTLAPPPAKMYRPPISEEEDGQGSCTNL